MAYTTASKYAVLTPYMLMEFMYANSPNPETYPVNTGTTTVGFNKLVNGYLDDDVQIFNTLVDESITNNTTENSVVRIDGSNYVTLDSNLIIPFNDFDDNLTSTDNLPIVFPSNISVVYDTVRIHIRAGYNLDNLDGVIVSVNYEDQDASYVPVACILIKKGTQQVYTLNTSPVTIGADIYDKYIEFKVPNLLSMQYNYLAASPSGKPSTLASLISKSGTGFNSSSTIKIIVDEVNSVTNYNGYSKYGTQRKATFPLEQENKFKDIGAVIKPSDSGEFFEYFATDDSGFIEDFILFQNSIGNSYYIYHQIEVIEQIGAAWIETSNFSNIQTTAYDVPNLFRPIVRNSSIATSFMIRYTMNLVNNADNTSVIRKSSYTSDSPGRYGTRITPIKISENPQVFKIYNKVYDQPSITLTEFVSETTVKEVIKFSNVFIQQNNVTTSIDNLVMTTLPTKFDSVTSRRKGISLKSEAVSRRTDSTRISTTTPGVGLTVDTKNSTGIIYGKGKGIIKLNPFDNYFKFIFYVEGEDGIPNKIDLETSGDYKLVFINNLNKKITINSLVSKNIADPSKGELAFLVEESISEKILNYNNKNFYISNMPIENSVDVVPFKKNKKKTIIKNGSSSVLYRGTWQADDAPETLNKADLTPRARYNTVRGTQGIPTYSDSPANRDIIPGLTDSKVTGNTALNSILPTSAINSDEFAPVNSENVVNTNPTGPLSGSSLVSAVSALISAFDTSDWTPQQIYNYFMVPGNVGYITYPNLTSDNFAEAASGILSDSDIALLITKGNERNAIQEEIRQEKIGFKIL